MNKKINREEEVHRIAEEICTATKEAGGSIRMFDAIALAEHLWIFQQNNIDVIRCVHLDGRISVQFNPVKNNEQTPRENL